MSIFGIGLAGLNKGFNKLNNKFINQTFNNKWNAMKYYEILLNIMKYY